MSILWLRDQGRRADCIPLRCFAKKYQVPFVLFLALIACQKTQPKVGEKYAQGFVVEVQEQEVFYIKPGGPLWQAFEDSFRVGKMGPPGSAHKLDIHPPEGGIEAIFPVYGTTPLTGKILFKWKGDELKGERPALFFFEGGSKQQKHFLLSSAKTQELLLETNVLGLKPGKTYNWYLGRIEMGKKIGQSRVYSFSILSEEEEKRLAKDLRSLKTFHLKTLEGKKFLRAQLFYQYQMYHAMINLLEPIYQKYATEGIRRLLFLGYVRIGRHAEAKKIAP